MRVCLYHITEPVLLLRVAGGPEYFNQVAQTFERTLHGVLIPLGLAEAVNGELLGPGLDKYVDDYTVRFDEARADRVESVFRQIPLFRTIAIDRTRLEESTGGWIEVIVEPEFELVDEMPGAMSGVLTWAVAESTSTW